jgi:MOSC domain-containing protein YiiM
VRDLDTLGGLKRAFGHTILGIYGEVVEGGNIDEGDTLAIGEQRFGA